MLTPPVAIKRSIAVWSGLYSTRTSAAVSVISPWVTCTFPLKTAVPSALFTLNCSAVTSTGRLVSCAMSPNGMRASCATAIVASAQSTAAAASGRPVNARGNPIVRSSAS